MFNLIMTRCPSDTRMEAAYDKAVHGNYLLDNGWSKLQVQCNFQGSPSGCAVYKALHQMLRLCFSQPV